MGSKLLLHICVLLCLGGYASAEDPGTDFAFVFMQNFLPDVGGLRLNVLLTAFFPDTQATIQLPNKNYSQVVPLAPKLPLEFELPAETEIRYSTRSNGIVRISSNKPISVVATNSKHYKTSVMVLSPIEDWGTDYYVMTPIIGPEDSIQQMAIVNGPQSNVASILLKGTVEFENTIYLAGEHLNFTLNPWETVQLQANGSLTGSHVLSQEPVALFSGRTCSEMRGSCQACFQLPPVSAWGSKFVSPPLPFQKFSSKIYILAATKTLVYLVCGFNTTDLMMMPGVVKEFDFDPMMNLLILSPGKILVFLYVGENLFEPSEGFLLNLMPREKACASYSIVWVPRYRHTLYVVAQENSQEGLQLNHEDLPQPHWKNIPGTDLVYALLPLDGRSDYYSIYNPGCGFGIGIIGMAEMNTYGAFGVCLDEVYNLCGFECSDELLCRDSACMSPEIQTCMAWGRTHMRTFQGTYHFQSGDCPLTFLASRGEDSNFVSFDLERRADYQFTVKLEVFETRLEISAESPNTALVNGELTYTPIVLEHGKLNIITVGLYISVKTSFGLHVILGDLGFVHIQIPRLYSGMLSGLCANQNPTERSTFNQHNPLPGITGDTNLNCNSGNLISPKLCETQDMSTYLTLCYQMVTSKIFQACHSALDPEPFVEACKFEVCATGNVCSGLGAYALACDIERVDMTGWRSLAGCDYACPPNSYHSMCALGCPAICGFNVSLVCPLACEEDCVCNPGYVLGDGGCILEGECGCYVGGQFLNNGEVFYEDGCRVACTCMHGDVACENHSCAAGEECQIIGGITACYPKPIGCWVFGEEHHTFDGASFMVHGECWYTMVTTECASGNNTDLDIEFQLNSNMLRNISSFPNIRLKIHGRTIIIQEYSDGIEVDGIMYPLPINLENGIRVSGNYFGRNPFIRIKADPGLNLMASLSKFWVNLPPTYDGNVCGLCGNANGNASDDTEGRSPQDFLANWISHRGNSLCGASPDTFNSDVEPFNLTDSYVGLDNITARDLDPSNFTAGDVDTSNLTASDLNPSNFTGGDVDTSNLMASDLNPSNFTGGDVDTSNLTASDLNPSNLTNGVVDLYNLTASCDVIVMANGAFQNCHDVLNPIWFFHTCLNYVIGGLVEWVCSTIKDYAFECQTIGVTVYKWENETVCDHLGT
ncbi:IgGFc-binding protein-like [Rana temporaria]|uniref:IgGFc-binding protein-like n=1 Tax=Rana temporaria TaxID=8407 RepID=UPI001AAC90D7|nr:IgGFc-binding protein-like [Rana temporaria]